VRFLEEEDATLLDGGSLFEHEQPSVAGWGAGRSREHRRSASGPPQLRPLAAALARARALGNVTAVVALYYLLPLDHPC
jgi:hypothetical protein